MSIITIDTLQFSQRLQKTGLKPEIANEIARTIKESQEESLKNLATKQDIELLQKEIHFIEHKVINMEQKMSTIEQRIISKLGSLLVIGFTILAALIKL